MLLKRHCGHTEDVRNPETREEFLMERGRTCRNCRKSKTLWGKDSRPIAGTGEEFPPRPMAMAMDLWRE